jgi:hypothetical protein
MTDYRRIPASHAAAALGGVKWSTPLATFLSCREAHAWDVNPEEPEAGIRFKAVLRAWAGRALGRSFHAVRTPFVAGGKNMFLSSQPDGMTADSSEALLVRTPLDPGRWQVDEVSEEGEVVSPTPHPVLPEDVRVEAAVTSLLTKASVVHVAVLLGGRMSFRSYVSEPGLKLEADLYALLSDFWKRVVAGKRPSAKEGDEDRLKKLFPKPTTDSYLPYAELTDVQREAVARLLAAQPRRTAATKEEKAVRPVVIEAIGGHSGINEFPRELGVDRIAYEERAPHANNATWKAIATELLERMSPRAKQRLLDKYTPTVGSRVLRPWWSGETPAKGAA